MTKATVFELRLTTGAVPVPVKESVCGLPVALSATETVALRAPVAVGVNVAAIVQLALDATVPIVRQSGAPPVGAARWKSPEFVPVNVTLVIVSVVAALFVNKEVICAVVPPVR